ncbi:MAG TPA: thioredoxin family protein [Alkalispirochaeta sp.]|nr:thioredoxin family protein [Alkalispirochaeta sp.]
MIHDILEKGMDPNTYVQNVRNYRSLMKRLFNAAEPNESHIARLRDAAQATQAVYATVQTEDWCGDSACIVPVLAPFFRAADIQLVIVRGSEQPEFKAYYENDGDDHIPAVSIWSKDGAELVRWIEAPEAAGTQKAAWKAEHPTFEPLYEKQKQGDSEAAKQFGALYRTFLEEMAGWYEAGMWDETTRELVEALEQRHH